MSVREAALHVAHDFNGSVSAWWIVLFLLIAAANPRGTLLLLAGFSAVYALGWA